MDRRAFISFVGANILAGPFVVDAQQPTTARRIALLMGSSESFVAPFIVIFRQALRALGYVDGGNIAIEYRYADGNYDRLPVLAAELVRLKFDVVVTEGTPPTRAAKQATTTIPIVMTVTGDPVAAGLVTNLARPGGNLTGASFFFPEIAAKRLQLLKEVIPGPQPCHRCLEPQQCSPWAYRQSGRSSGQGVGHRCPTRTHPSTR
jgi:putative ABC transport system substrate-binding protein